MSLKIKTLEKNRWSLATNDLTTCIECGKPKDDLHEIYEGAYRKKSMLYGCVIPLCRTCHNRIHTDYEMKIRYKKMFKKLFEEYYHLNFHDYFYFKELYK